MTDEPKPRTSNVSLLLLVLFAGFEVMQAVAQHDATFLFGTWLALTAALVMAMRLPDTRASLVGSGRLGRAFAAAEVSWVALAVAAGAVALTSGHSAGWIWTGGGAVGAVLTPLVVLPAGATR